MNTYRVTASSVEYYYLDIKAENEDEAWKIAYHADGSDFKSYAMGDWQIDGVEDAE